MGGRSNSRSGSTSKTGTMSDLRKGASKLEDAAKSYNSLQNDMMGKAFPAFGEMVQSAMSKFGDNPMANFMGAALGLPIQLEAPDFMQEFIDKYRPQEPATPAQQAPQPQTYNVNDDMRARMGMGGPQMGMGQPPQMGQYGQPNYDPYNIGGVIR